MPVPSPRNSIRIARGNYVDLAANATEIGEGELCFAIDQNKFYSKSGGALVAVGGGTELNSIAQLGDVDPSGVVDGQVLVYSGSEGKWIPADQTGGGDVESVNGKTGAVVLVVSDLANDAGYITAAEAPVQPGDLATVATTGSYNDLTDKPVIVPPPVPPVDSVNGQTGVVVLDASDVGAATTAQGALADSAIQPGVVNPVYFANQAAFPDATVNHGAVAHSHADGAMYFAHGGVWNKLANASDIPVNVSELNNDAGYLTTETVNNIDLSALPLLP